MAANDFAKQQTGPPRLTPSEVTRVFSGMSPLKATRYFNKCMTNPGTPDQNLDLMRQYRRQNPDRFLSDDQMKGQWFRGSWPAGRGYSGGYRDRSNGRVYRNDGSSCDNLGREYGADGSESGGYRDGGYSGRRTSGRSYWPRTAAPRKDPALERSPEEIAQVLTGLRSNVARTRYFQTVMRNPQSHEATVARLFDFRQKHPELFVSDQEALNAPRRSGGLFSGFRWSSLWKSQEEFDALPPKKKKFFVGAFRRRNRSKNTAYGLRVLVNPTTPVGDKQAMVETVNENPLLFFSKEQPSPGEPRSDYGGRSE